MRSIFMPGGGAQRRNELERFVMFHSLTGLTQKLIYAAPTLIAFATSSHKNVLLLKRKLGANHFLYTAPSSSAFIKQPRKKVPTHVAGLNVPQPNAQLITDAGNNSHAIPAKGIRTIPAMEDTVFAETSAIAARFAENPNSHLMKKYSTKSPKPIAHQENNLVSR